VKTYWSTAVAVDGRVVVSSGDETLAGALARAVTDCVYYQALYPAATIAVVDVRESCARCHNAGTVTLRRPRSVRAVRCPECKGKGAPGRLDDVPFVMPDPANGITLATAHSPTEPSTQL
jgi:hypothetical protein